MGVSLDKLGESIRCGEAQVRENLVLFPPFITNGQSPTDSYLLLEEGLKMGLLEVKEVTLEGDVNTIVITNNAEEPVLILDGEEIQGAKQNRVVNATIMLPKRRRKCPSAAWNGAAEVTTGLSLTNPLIFSITHCAGRKRSRWRSA